MLSPATAWSRNGEAILKALLVANLGLLLLFLACDYQLIFHSDSAVKNLLAQEIVETGRFFPPEWSYVNKDLWILYNHVLIVPLLAFLPNGYGVHALAGCVSALLILTGGWLLTRILGAARRGTLAALVVLSAGLSTMMAEHVYGQAAYGAMFWMGSFLLYGYWSQLQGRVRPAWMAVMVLLTLVVCWSNPQRALVYNVLPLLAAAATLYRLDRLAGTPRVAHWRTLGAFLLACVAGVALHAATLRGVRVTLGASELVWRDFPGMQANLLAVLRSTIALLDGLPHLDSKVVSPAGAYWVVRLLAALAALYVLPRTLLRLLGSAHRGRAFAAAFVAAALALTLILMLTTSLTDVQNPDGSVRYMVPALLGLLVLAAAAIADRLDGIDTARGGALLVLTVLATSAPTSYMLPWLQLPGKPPVLGVPLAEARLIGFLEQHQLRYGYASFWHAGKLTVLANHRVRIRPVDISDGLPVPARWLSSQRWYQPDYYRGPVFVLQAPGEPTIDTAALARHLGTTVRLLDFDGWRIAVFGRNLAESPRWDDQVRQPADYPVAATTPHGIGTFDPDLQALVAPAGAAGLLHAGPSRVLAPGTYEVRFDLVADAAAGELGVVEVVGRKARFGVAPVTAGVQPVLRWRLDKSATDVEFRVLSNGRAGLVLRGIRLSRVGDQ
ncbi:hypothetical protein E7V67_022130 [[Empedobacter] haloabium]|uniref:Glycosyltransferase RgtA/B/C/D-like domain-containing protein n=1 Tax=[Empedobacter] haloabium TaxID=592317 RepID=A0ABZ1UJD3_9BURK